VRFRLTPITGPSDPLQPAEDALRPLLISLSPPHLISHPGVDIASALAYRTFSPDPHTPEPYDTFFLLRLFLPRFPALRHAIPVCASSAVRTRLLSAHLPLIWPIMLQERARSAPRVKASKVTLPLPLISAGRVCPTNPFFEDI